MKANVEASSKITTVSLPRPDALGSDWSPTFAEIDTKPAAGAAPAGGVATAKPVSRQGSNGGGWVSPLDSENTAAAASANGESANGGGANGEKKNAHRLAALAEATAAEAGPSADHPMECLYRLGGGLQSRNWPIRSSIFVGAEAALPRRTTSVESRGGEEAADDDDEAAPPPSIQRTSLVASGSTDGHLYIYDVGGHAAHGGTLTQRLEGHSDRVYATSFHPHEPILASCSADFTLKIWVPQTGAAATIAAGRPGPSREPSVRGGNAFGGNGRGAVQ